MPGSAVCNDGPTGYAARPAFHEFGDGVHQGCIRERRRDDDHENEPLPASPCRKRRRSRYRSRVVGFREYRGEVRSANRQHRDRLADAVYCRVNG